MPNLVDYIKRTLPNECQKKGKLTKEGCTVSLKGAPSPSVKIDMDNEKAPVRQNEPKCDYIFIGGSSDVFFVPLELKKGKLDASDIVNQLQAGSNIAATRIIPKREQVQFLPVAVCRKFRRAEIRRLSLRKIRFNNQTSDVLFLKCDQPLVEILPKGK